MTTKEQKPEPSLEIRLGYKATIESVPRKYVFGRWYYQRGANVLPADPDSIKTHYHAYEYSALYECEYTGKTEEHGPFIIPEWVRVLDNIVSIVVLYTGEIRITKVLKVKN